ncbi:MAG: hypothetical protein M3114_03205 [Thermoproteota archaeon]|nr:hypothetical protein [Thermoproteota archaeon]
MMVNLLPLTPTEQAYLFDNTKDFTNAQQRYIRCRLKKKLRLLGEQLQRCNVAANERAGCNALNQPVPPSQSVATRDFYAPWSGREQCEQNPCWKAYGNASNRIWQTASSG